MITHFISSTASLFLSAALKSIREDVYTLLKDSTSANKLPWLRERSSLETNGAHFTGRPLQPLWFVSLLMGAEVPGPQAICFLEWQSERVQPASLNSSERKNHQHQLSSSQTGLLEYFLFTSSHYHTQALQIESLMPTGHLTHHRGDASEAA